MAGCSDPMPLSIDAMRADRHTATLTFERVLEDEPGFSAYLVSYRSSGLKVYAMVAVPNTPKPKAGFPVLVANHGFVPAPEKFGITADGIDSRPGDYYRDVPKIYTREGFLVVMPDYRGHNISEGFEFTTGILATNSYGGAIALYTNRPSQEFDASLKYTGGDYSRSDFEGMINFAISDSVSARIVGAHFEHDGYVENTFGGGDDLDDQDADYIRGSLLFEFENSSLIVRGEFFDQGGMEPGFGIVRPCTST